MGNSDAMKAKAEELIESVRGLPKVLKQLELASGQLPTDQDFHFYSNFKQFKKPVKDIENRVVSLLSEVSDLKEFCVSSSSWPADSEEAYDWLVGVQDDLLERVDAFLDKSVVERKEAKQKKPELPSSQAPPVALTSPTDVKVARKGKDGAPVRSPVPFHVRNIPRPQDKFDIAADNSNTPFKHRNRLDRKPQEGAVSSAADHGIDAKKAEPEDLTGSTHPLEVQLREMAFMEPLSEMLEATKPRSLEDTPFTFVDTLHSLKGMSDKLRSAPEIAVSTREEDFVVDTLAVRTHIGPCLGDIFSNSKILKVMHGADRDIVWLQRDFGIYVCNMFDTGQAARVLQLPGAGLAFLLEQFCGVIADKRYQLADWRIRPLPAEMMKYAREDTHYLLYVHDLLKQQLHALRISAEFDGEDPWVQVCRRSRDVCLQLYTKDIFTETSFLQLHGLYEKQFRPDQLAVVAKLYAWRDRVARKEDESTGYVLPNHLLFLLATEMPENIRRLQTLAKSPQTYVGRNAGLIVKLIREAKKNPLLIPVPPRSKPGLKDSKVQEGQKAGASSVLEVGAPVIFTSEDGDEVEELQVEAIRQEVEKIGMLKEHALSSPVLTPGPVVVSRKAGSMLFGSRRSKYTPASSSPVSLAPAGSATQLETETPSAVQPDASGCFGTEPIPIAAVEGGKGFTQSNVEVFSTEQLNPPLVGGQPPSLDPTSKTDMRMADVTELAPSETKCVETGLLPCRTDVELLEELLENNEGSSFHEVATTSHFQSKTPTRNVPEVKLKCKAVGFGASLFGRNKEKSKGVAQPATISDQKVQARMKAKAVEFSIALPFRATTALGNQAVCEDNVLCLDTQGQKEVLGDVLMLENEGKNNHIVDSTTDEERHTNWWPPMGAESVPAGVDEGLVDAKGKKPKGTDASATSSDQRDPSFPPSLSESHRTHRRRKRNSGGGLVLSGGGLVLSGGGLNGAKGTQNSGERTDQRKKSKVEQPKSGKAIDLDACAVNGSFNYAEARKRLGLENLYVGEVDEQNNSGRGRGKLNKKPKTSNKVISLGFDALRTARVDPKPEGIPNAPRRQVYSMTGNRSATFRK